jgi:predicted AlkP superfamily pyrophosphatase or phosphodiesterase
VLKNIHKLKQLCALAVIDMAAILLSIIGSAPVIANSGAPSKIDPPKPKLVVAISVDQFSADLFAEYRGQFTGGLKRLQQGVVFPSGYQSHAATETCPGHSTILTGARPARSGIIANDWLDPNSTRKSKSGTIDYAVYCAEDESISGSNSSDYTVSSVHLKVPTLGDRLKIVSPDSRVVAVSGKDRAAVMMGGHKTDSIWWWGGKSFVTYKGINTPPPASVAKVNALATADIAKAYAPALSPKCISHNVAVSIGGGKSVGTLQPRKADDARGFRATSQFDQRTLDLATGLIGEMQLGKKTAVDVIAISLSATDYVGHTYGTAGGEMCQQVFALDTMLGMFFAKLDTLKTTYAVVLTADHGGHDLPERNRQNAALDAKRIAGPTLGEINKQLASKYQLSFDPLLGQAIGGDAYLNKNVPAPKRQAILDDAMALLAAHPDVFAVFGRESFLKRPAPSGPSENYSLLDRAMASFDPVRSGDLYVVLKPRVTPIPTAGLGYVATHGSIWDYDRRVPILFWWPGAQGFEQPLGVETVDILPTLASLIDLPVPAAEIDGHCLDLERGEESNCK